jgi:hypothetical protein
MFSDEGGVWTVSSSVRRTRSTLETLVRTALVDSSSRAAGWTRPFGVALAFSVALADDLALFRATFFVAGRFRAVALVGAVDFDFFDLCLVDFRVLRDFERFIERRVVGRALGRAPVDEVDRFRAVALRLAIIDPFEP